MKKVKSFQEFVNESNNTSEVLNEKSYQYSDVAVKVAAEMMKGNESVELSEDTYEKIKTALAKTNPYHGIFKDIVSSKFFTKKLQNELKYDWHQNTFVFKGDKLVHILRLTGGAGQKTGEIVMADGEWMGWNEAETWAYEKFPKFFSDKWWEVYAYSDPYKGWGNAGTIEFVKAPTQEIAKSRVQAPGSDKHDPFWIDNGIQEISAKEMEEKKQRVRAMAEHYAKLAKQLG